MLAGYIEPFIGVISIVANIKESVKKVTDWPIIFNTLKFIFRDSNVAKHGLNTLELEIKTYDPSDIWRIPPGMLIKIQIKRHLFVSDLYGDNLWILNTMNRLINKQKQLLLTGVGVCPKATIS